MDQMNDLRWSFGGFLPVNLSIRGILNPASSLASGYRDKDCMSVCPFDQHYSMLERRICVWWSPYSLSLALLENQAPLWTQVGSETGWIARKLWIVWRSEWQVWLYGGMGACWRMYLGCTVAIGKEACVLAAGYGGPWGYFVRGPGR